MVEPDFIHLDLFDLVKGMHYQGYAVLEGDYYVSDAFDRDVEIDFLHLNTNSGSLIMSAKFLKGERLQLEVGKVLRKIHETPKERDRLRKC